MTYEVTITLLDVVEYKGLLTLHNNKIYIRSLIDSHDYEKMLRQLIDDGDIIAHRDGIDYDIQVTDFQNDIESIFQKLIDDGFSLTYEEIEDTNYSFSLVADGDDLNPEVIAYLGTGVKFVSLAESLFRYVNRMDYEPKINIRASSYAVDVQEVTNDRTALEQFIEDVNNQNINIDRYMSDSLYSKVINRLFDVASVGTMKILKIEFNEDDYIGIDIRAVKKLKGRFKSLLETHSFKKNVNTRDSLRAFDDKKKKAILDVSPTYYLHFNDNSVYEAIKEAYQNNSDISINGSYKSKQTILVDKIQIL